MDLLTDEGIVLHVKPWQNADKYAVCFTKEHGKVRFVAYGARYPKNVQGRLLQPFSCLRLEVQPGQRIDKLRSCELVEVPATLDMKQMAYASVLTELTAVLTEDRAPQEELYELLQKALVALRVRNPRLVTLAFGVQLLGLIGLAPQLNDCVQCGRELASADEAWFSPLNGGVLCASCRQQHVSDGLEVCSSQARKLWAWLASLDFEHPSPFNVRGGALMEAERIFFHFIFFQTDKPLNSLSFLQQLGL